MGRVTGARVTAGFLVLASLLASPLGAQDTAGAAGKSPDTVVVTPGAHYRAGGLHTLFFGKHYRDLWTTPIRVPVLDLKAAWFCHAAFFMVSSDP